MKLIKLTLLAVIALVATTNLAFSQNTTTTDQTTYHAEAAEPVVVTKTIEVKVKGVGCNTDIKTISANVEKLEGVTSCEVAKKGATTIFKVSMNTALVTEKEVYAAIENTAGCKNPSDRPYKVKV